MKLRMRHVIRAYVSLAATPPALGRVTLASDLSNREIMNVILTFLRIPEITVLQAEGRGWNRFLDEIDASFTDGVSIELQSK